MKPVFNPKIKNKNHFTCQLVVSKLCNSNAGIISLSLIFCSCCLFLLCVLYYLPKLTFHFFFVRCVSIVIVMFS